MDILGIGIPELTFIIIIALIVLGPKDMQKTGKTIGTWLRKIVLSPEWRDIKDASRKIKRLPNQLMREANIEEFEQYKRDLGSILPNNLLDGDDKTDAPYGAWSGKGMGMHKKTKPAAPRVDKPPAPVKSADLSQETPSINDSLTDSTNA